METITEFIIFDSTDTLQQLIIIWDKEDAYADEIKRIIASVELIKINQE